MGYLTRAAALGLGVAMLAGYAGTALAQKDGGVLKFYHRGTPPSGSIHDGTAQTVCDSSDYVTRIPNAKFVAQSQGHARPAGHLES